MTGSMTGLPIFQQHFNLPVDDIKHTVTPHYYWNAADGMSEQAFSAWCAEQLEKLILTEGPETVAAFIAEPVMGTGGLIPPPEGYWDAVQPILKKYDVLLIADEVVTAFGRIGYAFGSERYGIRPDLITVAKGLTSGYLPLSGVIVGDKVWSVLEQGCGEFGPFGHGWTYSAHALAMAAGLANLDILERENVFGNATTVGDYFQQRLHAEFDEHSLVGEVRGVALLGALEFVADKTRKQRFDVDLKVGARVAGACLEHGLIARAMPHGDILGFAPPLIVTRENVDEIIDRTRRAVDGVTDELVREGSLAAA
jgi:L-2,4-diaminobutyrate transaminase